MERNDRVGLSSRPPHRHAPLKAPHHETPRFRTHSEPPAQEERRLPRTALVSGTARHLAATRSTTSRCSITRRVGLAGQTKSLTNQMHGRVAGRFFCRVFPDASHLLRRDLQACADTNPAGPSASRSPGGPTTFCPAERPTTGNTSRFCTAQSFGSDQCRGIPYYRYDTGMRQ